MASVSENLLPIDLNHYISKFLDFSESAIGQVRKWNGGTFPPNCRSESADRNAAIRIAAACVRHGASMRPEGIRYLAEPEEVGDLRKSSVDNDGTSQPNRTWAEIDVNPLSNQVVSTDSPLNSALTCI